MDRKIILLTGPRQTGKTTLSRSLGTSFDYLNYDLIEHQKLFLEKSWDRKKKFIILDELHKKNKWKQWLKGIFDVEGLKPQIIVTGSAKMDTYKKVGDSLAGRYFQYRIHPLDVRELRALNSKLKNEEIIDRLLHTSGFPEPFLEGNVRFYNLWEKTHLDIILKQDLIDLEEVKKIKSLEILIELLKDRIGSPLSYSSLAKDLQHSDKTIKSWLTLLEKMYIVFKLTPFHKNVSRSNLKKPKYYFYDIARIRNNPGAQIENLVACSLLKECHFRKDCLGENWDLHYLMKKGGLEIDFLITHNEKPHTMIEVKTSDDTLSKNFKFFETHFPDVKKIQLVKNLTREKTYPNGCEIRRLDDWLCEW